jgi:hypothetical protein
MSIISRFMILQPSAVSIIVQKRRKNPVYPKTPRIIHPRTSPTTFARFWRIFIGQAAALASISERPLEAA